MARRKTNTPQQPLTGIPQQPLPESGERVIGMPTARSKHSRNPKPQTSSETRAINKARTRRTEWEQSDAGKERLRNPLLEDPAYRGLSLGRIHALMNYGEPRHVGPTIYDVQLPGMADPNAAPRPPRWEELPESARQHAIRGLAKHGTSIEQLSEDWGTQYDQAKHRQWSAGASDAYAETFYSTGEPRKVVESSARTLGIPSIIHAQMNAMTSPNTKFSHTYVSGENAGKTVYPNDVAAQHAVRWVQQGLDPQNITNELETTGLGTGRSQGYITNLKKAALSFDQFSKGVAPADWVTRTGGQGPFEGAPKTGPYANSWSDSHPQFFVSDVHSGGGGGLPHLSRGKAEGKSEREKAIASIPFFHSAMDYAVRQAMQSRNISHLREAQAAQWGEEQIQRPDIRDVTANSAYPQKSPKREIEGQMSLF